MSEPAAVRESSFGGLIGVTRADITPPVGIYARNWGAAKHDAAEGIHRPLTLTCATLQSDEDSPPLVLVSTDLGWWKHLWDERFVREQILKLCGLDESQLLFCLSHTHSGPVVVRDDPSLPGADLVEPYLEKLRDTTVAAYREALDRRARATLTWRYGRCDLATNRDLSDPSRDRVVCGFNPSTRADDTLLVGRITNDASGKVIGTIVNYACHPTTLAWQNHLISPDYVGAMRDVIEGATSAAPCLFLQGASGELSPAQQYTGDLAVADANGRRLGYAAMATLDAMLPPGKRLQYGGVVESGAPLAIWNLASDLPSSALTTAVEQVEFPLKPLPSAAELEEQWRRAPADDRVARERLLRKRNVRRGVGDGASSRVPLWVCRMGDAILVAHMNEAYSPYQTELRRRLAPRAVAVVGLCNGSIGYLPPRELYDKDIYQVWQTPYAAGSFEILIEQTTEAVRRIL